MSYQSRPRWSGRQLSFLIENWDTMSDEKIAELLGKTLKSVRRKRERLELKKACGRGIVKAFDSEAPKPKSNAIFQKIQSSQPDGTIIFHNKIAAPKAEKPKVSTEGSVEENRTSPDLGT